MKKHDDGTDNRRMIQIEVVFASPSKQNIINLEVPQNTTVKHAVKLSGISENFPDFDFDSATIGIFGKIVPNDYLLADNERVEIYRPLHQSPTDARRIRVRMAQMKVNTKN